MSVISNIDLVQEGTSTSHTSLHSLPFFTVASQLYLVYGASNTATVSKSNLFSATLHRWLRSGAAVRASSLRCTISTTFRRSARTTTGRRTTPGSRFLPMAIRYHPYLVATELSSSRCSYPLLDSNIVVCFVVGQELSACGRGLHASSNKSISNSGTSDSNLLLRTFGIEHR